MWSAENFSNVEKNINPLITPCAPLKVQNKIYKVIEAVETLERIPSNYLKHLQDGLYETRIQLGSNIWRVLCFFDGDKVVVLLMGFQKKTQKTPSSEQELN